MFFGGDIVVKSGIRLKAKAAFALLVVLMLVLTACGGGGGGGSSSSSSSSGGSSDTGGGGAAGASSSEPVGTVKIGVLMPYTGTFAPLTDSLVKGFDLYIEEQGGLLGGRKADVQYLDDEANPQTALRQYRQLVQGSKVDILVGTISSSVEYALRDEVEKDKILLVNPNASASDLSWERKSDYVYRVSYSGWQQGASPARYLAENVGKTAVTLASNYPAGYEIIEAFKTAYEQAGGRVVEQLWPELNTNDFSPQLTQIANIKPDIVFSFLAGSDQFRFTQQYSEFGLKKSIPLTGNNNYADYMFTSTVGEAADGIIAATQYIPWLENDVNRKFVENYRNKYGKLPDMFSEQGYVAAMAIDKAIEKANSTKTEDLIQVMKGLTLDAPRGTIVIDPETHNPIMDFYVTENIWQNGEIITRVIDKIPQYAMPAERPSN